MNNAITQENPYESPDHIETNTSDERYQPKIFSLNGRIGRLRYFAYSWLYNVLSMVIIGILVAIFIPTLTEGDPEAPSGMMFAIMALLYLPVFFCFIVAARRRLHDLNSNGWLSLLVLVPLVNFFFAIYLLVWPGSSETNDYGPRTTSNPVLLILIGLLGPIMVIGILAAVAIPAYQDFLELSQQAPLQTP